MNEGLSQGYGESIRAQGLEKWMGLERLELAHGKLSGTKGVATVFHRT